MRKFMKFGTIASVAIIPVAAVFSAAALADSPEGEPAACQQPAGNLSTEVADILGLDAEQVADAFTEARQDTREEVAEAFGNLSPRELFISNLADTLGITEEQLTAAIEEARQELQVEIQERQEERLQNAVENGTITEDEANQIREWWQNRPAALDKLRPAGRPLEGMGGNGRFGNGGLWQDSQNMEESEAILPPTAF
jgi:hypothetical protein